MVSLRKASSYSKKRVRPFTRKSRTKRKAYIKTVPGIKIAKFQMGNQKAYAESKHPYVVRLISDERVSNTSAQWNEMLRRLLSVAFTFDFSMANSELSTPETLFEP